MRARSGHRAKGSSFALTPTIYRDFLKTFSKNGFDLIKEGLFGKGSIHGKKKKEEIMKCDSIVLFLSVCLKILYLETFP